MALTFGPATGAGQALAQNAAPDWVQLSPAQKNILAPLEEDWDNLEPERRQRWLGLAAR